MSLTAMYNMHSPLRFNRWFITERSKFYFLCSLKEIFFSKPNHINDLLITNAPFLVGRIRMALLKSNKKEKR
ncbi:hypothetical protein A2I42_03755 [Salmonella enterica]|uniref:Uncharacterized protein n=1 Tax=Salmonella enterica TaxID=28901 RepID=A0A3F3IZX9_SALER|nr:hypothetical protein [Salmonella enterica]ECV1143863.1 hypothetical protein [Salmonella enterica subsp. enterica]OHG31920.1 hypothetical protein A7T58_09875 [Salmonella enterica subsp. diarizonae serovar 16:z10:e,n,x,z15]OHK48120.1 hypothetical protein A7S73_10025 [Salmonella enterica subsp. enterica serovar Mbandaka]EAA9127516.1 hypothetical protein [Salmonella enterica]